jgi:hypothetical protein
MTPFVAEATARQVSIFGQSAIGNRQSAIGTKTVSQTQAIK